MPRSASTAGKMARGGGSTQQALGAYLDSLFATHISSPGKPHYELELLEMALRLAMCTRGAPAASALPVAAAGLPDF
jgi:hypothetical protein